jgi:hypothetical protein
MPQLTAEVNMEAYDVGGHHTRRMIEVAYEDEDGKGVPQGEESPKQVKVSDFANCLPSRNWVNVDDDDKRGYLFNIEAGEPWWLWRQWRRWRKKRGGGRRMDVAYENDDIEGVLGGR